MINFHAVLVDETGCEFGADMSAPSRDIALDMLRDMYPESRVVQLESPEDTRQREHRLYMELEAEDWDGEEDEDFEDEDWDGDGEEDWEDD